MFPVSRPRPAAALLAGILLVGLLPAVALADPPVANPDAYPVFEDAGPTSLDVRSNDTDTESDPLTITGVTVPSHGTTSTDGSTVMYTPDANYVRPGLVRLHHR